MTFELLPATVQDAPEIAILVNSAYRGDSSRQGWTTEADLLDGTRTDAAAIEEIIRQPDHWIMKYIEEGQLLGCVELHRSGEKLYLGMLTVRPHLQGKGIGKNMLLGAEAEARKLKCHSVYMTVISIRKELIDWIVYPFFFTVLFCEFFHLSRYFFRRDTFHSFEYHTPWTEFFLEFRSCFTHDLFCPVSHSIREVWSKTSRFCSYSSCRSY